MAGRDYLAGELIRHGGFTKDQWEAFDDRIKLAFDGALNMKVRKASWSREWNSDAS